MKINVYSPLNGDVQNITKLDDPVFSKEMLGQGFYVKAKKDTEINSVFEWSKLVNIFETRHGFVLENKQKINFLIHIGIDTVNLFGEPFKFEKKVDDVVKLNEKILDVDFSLIKKAKLEDAVCCTFINQNEIEGWKFVLDKTGLVKKGELIGHLEFSQKIKEKSADNELEILKFGNKYEKLAEFICKSIGGLDNYDNFYNCMTRLRFGIKDKSIVDEETLKKNRTIQGVIWNGRELQIVIGADVLKAKDAFDNYVKKIKNKNENIGWFEIAKASVSGVVTNIIPYLIASGLLYALMSVLQSTGAISGAGVSYTGDITSWQRVIDADLFSGVLYIICSTGLSFMAFMFGLATIKYLNGNIFTGGLVLFILTAPQLVGGLSWTLFTIGGFEFKIQGYAQIIIPQVFAAYLFVKVDNFLKKIIPSLVDLVLRPAIGVFLVTFVMFFAVGPLLSLLELFFGYVFELVEMMPFGLAPAFWALLTVPLTVLGLLWAVGAPINIQMSKGVPSLLGAAYSISEFAQAGAVFAVALRTKNSNLRKLAIGTGITGTFGITEPLLYGVNLPKFKPFIAGLIGAFIAGWVSGLLDSKAYTVSAGGWFYWTKFIAGGGMEVLKATICIIISFSISFVISYFTYEEIKNTKKSLMKLIGYVNKRIFRTNKQNQGTLQKDLDVIDKMFDEDFYNLEKSFQEKLISKIKLDTRILTLTEKEETLRKKLIRKVPKLEKLNDIESLKKLNDRYLNNKFSKEIIIVNEQLIKADKELSELTAKVEISHNNVKKAYDNWKNDLEKMNLPYFDGNVLDSNYNSIMDNTEIVFDIKEKQRVMPKKRILNPMKRTKTLV